jgi:hypothetical protein
MAQTSQRTQARKKRASIGRSRCRCISLRRVSDSLPRWIGEWQGTNASTSERGFARQGCGGDARCARSLIEGMAQVPGSGICQSARYAFPCASQHAGARFTRSPPRGSRAPVVGRRTTRQGRRAVVFTRPLNRWKRKSKLGSLEPPRRLASVDGETSFLSPSLGAETGFGSLILPRLSPVGLFVLFPLSPGRFAPYAGG